MHSKQDFLNIAEELKAKINLASQKVDLELLRKEQSELAKQAEAEGFWSDPDTATKVSTKLKHLTQKINDWNSIISDLDGVLNLLKEVNEEDLADFEVEFESVFKRAQELYLASLLDGKYDANSAILSVVCGTGGKDAQDFTQMLARMYLRYTEKQGFNCTLLSETVAEDVGLKNITFLIEGENAYGYLKNEHGVHRLVRLSDFNSGNTRETSFAMVDVIPEVELESQVEINSEDLKIDVFRASGAGGQHVNTTDSAVRITHLPTGIVVSSQSDRSQHKNKENALKMLFGKLIQLMQEKNIVAVDDLRGVKTEMAWGNQIRSYVLHPYKMVKDHRTGFEVSNPDKVFDGDIQSFIEAKLVS